jgi:hypothetical protein
MKLAITTLLPEPEIVLQSRRFETNRNHPTIVACAVRVVIDDGRGRKLVI